MLAPIALALVVYWFVAMKRFYALGWFGALWRGTVLLTVYQIVLSVVLFVVLLIAMMLA